MTRLSASGVPRALACPASLVYPQHRYDTAEAAAGTERHAEMEAAIDVGNAADVLPLRVLELIHDGDEQFTELAMAYDCATNTARVLGHGRSAYRGLAPFEIPGCLDLLVVGGGRAIVVDKKSYVRVGEEQPLTYALMVARHYGLDDVTIVLFYELGAVDISVATALDLDAHAERLKGLLVDIARAQHDPTKYLKTGPHCRYCPAFLSCPKQHALTLELSSGDAVMAIERRIPFDDDEDAARAFDLLGRLKMLTTRVQAALYARAAERPIFLSDGQVLGPVTKQGNERLDGDVTYAVIRDLHGQGIADAAVERRASKTRIKEALRFAGSKGEIAKLERQVLDEVRKRGGATRETKTVIEVHEAGPRLLKTGEP